MNDYNGPSVDLFMRQTLEADLTPDETDNALTLLTTLTTLAGDSFPHGDTFVKVVKASDRHTQGVSFFTLDSEGREKHSAFIGRTDLGSLNDAMEALFAIMTYGVLSDGNEE